jgi:hypothetical protein
MNILLGFAPYIAFFLFMRTVSIDAGLWVALVVAVLIGARNWARSGSLKILEAGTVLIFLVLVIFTAAEHWKWTVMAVRLAVDASQPDRACGNASARDPQISYERLRQLCGLSSINWLGHFLDTSLDWLLLHDWFQA